MRLHHLLLMPLLMYTAIACAEPDTAPTNPVPGYFSFSFENDFYFDSDDGYSNGFQFAWARGSFDQFGGTNTKALTAFLAPPWIKAGKGYQRAVTHKLGNVMYTPDDLEAAVPPPGDVPYSGTTYWRTDWLRFNEKVVDRAWGTIGIVGPASGSQKMQEYMHTVIGATYPNGWDTQLRNEPVFELGVVRDWRVAVQGTEASGSDVVLITSGNIGNLSTRLDAGVVVRSGHNLFRSFPAVGVLPGREVNPVAGATVDTAHMFLGLMYRYEAWNIAIDGNTSDPSGSTIHRVPNQFYASIGGSWNMGSFGFLVSFAESTKRFEEAEAGDSFGSMSVTWRYR